MLEQKRNISSLSAKEIMNATPKTMDADALAYEGLKLMENNNISQLIILEKGRYAGIVHIHEIIKEEIV